MIEAPHRVERKLEASGRITPRQVLEAYEETGLTPIQHEFFFPGRACALGAMAIANGFKDSECVDVFGFLKDRLAECPDKYMVSFASGFDGHPFAIGHDEGRGYYDGLWVRRFVLDRYPELAA